MIGPKARPPRASRRAIELLESRRYLGKNDGQLPEHARRLGPLARKNKRHRLVGPGRPGLEDDASGIVEARRAPRRSRSEPASAFRAGLRARRPRWPGSPAGGSMRLARIAILSRGSACATNHREKVVRPNRAL